jgi:SAM-dependent methyltransferase
LLERLEQELAAGQITEDQWYREVASVITPAYLAGDNPRAQSGSSSDDVSWQLNRGLIADAIHKDGTFLDVGCASGYLMECVVRWARARGFAIEPYGLDIAPELADLARLRLPQWADRVFVGNAINWLPPQRFDFVHTGLEYVPRRRQRDLVAHLLDNVVAPGGRLIIGPDSEEPDKPGLAELLTGWGYTVAGQSERPHRDPRLVRRAIWIIHGEKR